MRQCTVAQQPPLEQRLERLRSEVMRHIGRLERCENTVNVFTKICMLLFYLNTKQNEFALQRY